MQGCDRHVSYHEPGHLQDSAGNACQHRLCADHAQGKNLRLHTTAGHLHGCGAEGERLEAGAIDGGGRRGAQQRLNLRLQQRAQGPVERRPQDLQRIIQEPARIAQGLVSMSSSNGLLSSETLQTAGYVHRAGQKPAAVWPRH